MWFFINIICFSVVFRTLGNIASVIAEKKSIHHSIRNSLDSHDAVEMKAAIYATAKFAAQSKWVLIYTKYKVIKFISRVFLHKLYHWNM